MSEERAVNINVCTLGHVDHGKTTLTAAITKYCAEFDANTKALEYEKIDKTPEEKKRGITINSTTVEYSWKGRHYSHTDCPGHEDYVKNMIVGASQVDAALLVIAATDGVMPQTTEHVLLANQLGIKKLIIVINKCDAVADKELLTLVEEDVKQLIKRYNYDETTTPIVHCSALKANEGDPEAKKGIEKLLDIMNDYIKIPVREENKPFLLSIEDVFTITGRGTVVTGKVERGSCSLNDTVDIVGLQEKPTTTVVTGLECFRKAYNKIVAGDNAGVLLRGIQRENIFRGQVIAAPGSIVAHKKFTAQVYILTKEEGGRSTGFVHTFKPQAFIRTADITCSFSFPEGVEMVAPGDNVLLTIELIEPMALEQGTKFAIREGGHTVAAGKVVDVLD